MVKVNILIPLSIHSGRYSTLGCIRERSRMVSCGSRCRCVPRIDPCTLCPCGGLDSGPSGIHSNHHTATTYTLVLLTHLHKRHDHTSDDKDDPNQENDDQDHAGCGACHSHPTTTTNDDDDDDDWFTTTTTTTRDCHIHASLGHSTNVAVATESSKDY